MSDNEDQNDNSATEAGDNVSEVEAEIMSAWTAQMRMEQADEKKHTKSDKKLPPEAPPAAASKPAKEPEKETPKEEPPAKAKPKRVITEAQREARIKNLAKGRARRAELAKERRDGKKPKAVPLQPADDDSAMPAQPPALVRQKTKAKKPPAPKPDPDDDDDDDEPADAPPPSTKKPKSRQSTEKKAIVEVATGRKYAFW